MNFDAVSVSRRTLRTKVSNSREGPRPLLPFGDVSDQSIGLKVSKKDINHKRNRTVACEIAGRNDDRTEPSFDKLENQIIHCRSGRRYGRRNN